MTRFLTLSLVLASLTVTANAQGGVTPNVHRGPYPTAALNPPHVPFTQVSSLHMMRLPGNPAGTVTVALGGFGLPTSAGGRGRDDLVTGTYDLAWNTFTPDTYAAALNTSSRDRSLRFLHTGLLAVFDRYINGWGQVMIAQRPNLTSPWQVLGAIRNLPSEPEHDPALVMHQGQLHLIFIGFGGGIQITGDLRMAPLDLQTLTLGAHRVLVKSSFQSGGIVHSPEVITDSRGELIGLSHQDGMVDARGRVTSSAHHFSFDLDPSTPPIPTVANPGSWMMYASLVGGRLFMVDWNPTTGVQRVVDAELTWWNGGRAPVGGTMELQLHVPPKVQPGRGASSLIAVSTRFLSTPIQVPGLGPLGGMLGVDPSTTVIIPVGGHDLLTGLATLAIPVPANPGLKGLVLPAQSVMYWGLLGPNVELGNTATLRIE